MKGLKKVLKVLGFIFAGIFLLLLVVSIFIDPIAKNFIVDKINNADEGQYNAEIEEVNVSLIRGNFIVNGIQIQTDTLTARKNKTPVVDVEAGEVSLEGVSWLKFLFSNNLDVNRISFLDLKAQAKVRTISSSDTTKPFKWEHLDIYPLIKDHIDRIHLNDLRFRNIDLTLLNIESQDTLKFAANEFNVQSDDILIDADRVFSDSRTFYASKIDIKGKEVEVIRLGSDRWKAELEVIEVDTRQNDLGISSKNGQFFKRGTSKKDTTFFTSFNSFNLNSLNMNRVQEDSVAKISNIELSDVIIINNFDIDKEDVEKADKQNPGFDITEFTLGDNLPDLLDRIILNEVVLENVNYKELEHLSVKHFNFSAREIMVDKKPAFADDRFLHAEIFEVSVGNMYYLERKNLIQLALENFNIDIEDGMGDLKIGNTTANHLDKTPGKLNVDAELAGFLIKGIDTRDLEKKKFSIDSIAVEYPELLVDLGGEKSSGTSNNTQSPPLDLYPAIEGILTEVQVNKIALIAGDFKVVGMQSNQSAANLPEVYVQLSDIVVAEGTAFSNGRILHADDIAVRMERINYRFPDNVRKVNLNLLRLSTREKFLKAYGLTYDYNNNFRKLLRQTETNQIISINNNKFLINNLEYESLIKRKGVFASSVVSEGLKVEVFKDNHYEAEEKDKEVYPTPQQMIKDIGQPLYLGEVSVNDADIIFEELAEEAEKPGRFSINNFNVNINNLTNVQSIINNTRETAINVNGLLMGAGYFETEMLIPMYNENEPVKIAGKVDTLDLTKLNRYTEFTTRFGLESGILYKVVWDFESGKQQANGKFGLSYEDLNVQLSKSDSPAPAGTLYQIGAYLANALVLDSDISEAKSDPPKTAEFEREKEEEEGFVEHYIFSMMQGFTEVIGFPLSIIDP